MKRRYEALSKEEKQELLRDAIHAKEVAALVEGKEIGELQAALLALDEPVSEHEDPYRTELRRFAMLNPRSFKRQSQWHEALEGLWLSATQTVEEAPTQNILPSEEAHNIWP